MVKYILVLKSLGRRHICHGMHVAWASDYNYWLLHDDCYKILVNDKLIPKHQICVYCSCKNSRRPYHLCIEEAWGWCRRCIPGEAVSTKQLCEQRHFGLSDQIWNCIWKQIDCHNFYMQRLSKDTIGCICSRENRGGSWDLLEHQNLPTSSFSRTSLYYLYTCC